MNSTRPYKLPLFLGLAILLMPLVGVAAITFDGSGATALQQTSNSPCVIGNNSCNQPAGFTYTASANGGGGTSYDFFSPVYQAIATSPFLVGDYSGNHIPTTFSIGIDENIAAGQGPESLVFFRTLLCTDATGSSCAIVAVNSYQPGSPTTIPNNNNGNGFSDANLNGFSLTANSFYKFEASVANDTDGMEQFFVVPVAGPQAVPEPRFVSLLLFAAMSLVAIGLRKRASVQ